MCVNIQPNLYYQYLADDWLMIVGGYHQDDESGYVHHFTLLLALEPEENPVPPCLEKLNNFSMHTAWMHGGTDKGSWAIKLQRYNISTYCSTKMIDNP